MLTAKDIMRFQILRHQPQRAQADAANLFNEKYGRPPISVGIIVRLAAENGVKYAAFLRLTNHGKRTEFGQVYDKVDVVRLAQFMARPAKFQVDSRLATLLGAGYHSSEQAIQELVDNAWDADADHVWITLPAPVTSAPVILKDDGSGMVEQEVRKEYLKIARDRRAMKGNTTPRLHRPVKGRKGIGKFAGLMMAGVMHIDTRAHGQSTRLTILKEDLQMGSELEALPLPIDLAACEPEEHGTTVTLSSLDQHLNYPSAERLKELLVLEYGREQGFDIFVNDEAVGIEDVRGAPSSAEASLPTAGPVHLRLRITEDRQPARQAGIALRIGGKIIGRPSYFGLDQANDIPLKVLRRVYGEIEADGLSEDVTGNGFGIVENSKGYGELQDFVQRFVREQLQATCAREMNLAKARLALEIQRSLEKLPEYRRESARRAIERIMQQFYDESEERIRPIISVVLDALERDEYWQVLERLDQARHEDVGALSQALHDFGVLELSMVAQQARRRLVLLDKIDELIAESATHEQVLHTALSTNLWIFGPDFALMSSNKTLTSMVEKYSGERFKGERGNKRPDLLLLSQFAERYVLIEFKRPSHTIGRPDISQAEQYRDDLNKQFSPMSVWVVGGAVDTNIQGRVAADTMVASYAALISRARQQLAWLLDQLSKEEPAAVS
jgi:hypothetical protein